MLDFGVRARAKGRNDSMDTSLKKFPSAASPSIRSPVYTQQTINRVRIAYQTKPSCPLLPTFAPSRPWPT